MNQFAREINAPIINIYIGAIGFSHFGARVSPVPVCFVVVLTPGFRMGPLRRSKRYVAPFLSVFLFIEHFDKTSFYFMLPHSNW